VTKRSDLTHKGTEQERRGSTAAETHPERLEWPAAWVGLMSDSDTTLQTGGKWQPVVFL
jgi:hypothetical protein